MSVKERLKKYLTHVDMSENDLKGNVAFQEAL